MKFLPVLMVGSMALFPACSKQGQENSQQAYAQYLAAGQLTMTTLQVLDTGDIPKTRHVAMISLHTTLEALPDLAAKSEPTAEEKQQEIALARQVLDYMVAHRDEWDPRLLSVQAGMRGLRKILIEPEDVRKLKEFSDYLAAKQTAKP